MSGGSPAGPPPIRAVLSGDAFALQRRGGVSRYFAELHLHLRSLGVRSEVAAPLWLSEHLEPGPGVAGLRLPAWAARRGASRACRRLGAAAESKAVVAARADGGELVLHRTYYSSRPRPAHVPVIETVFDMIHEDHPSLTASRDRSAEWKRASLRTADHVITISEHTRSRLLAHHDLDPDRVTTVHLGVSELAPDPREVVALEHGAPFILYVGAREAYKNFERFVEAAAAVLVDREQLRIRVFGGGAPTSADRDVVARHGLARRVDFVGGSDGSLAAHYAAATVLVYPSFDEGFGLPPLEALSLGCAVASSRAGAMPEVLADAALYFDPADVADMSRTITELVDRPGRRAELVARGDSRVRRFTWDRVARETLDVYRRVIDHRQTAAARAG